MAHIKWKHDKYCEQCTNNISELLYIMYLIVISILIIDIHIMIN